MVRFYGYGAIFIPPSALYCNTVMPTVSFLFPLLDDRSLIIFYQSFQLVKSILHVNNDFTFILKLLYEYPEFSSRGCSCCKKCIFYSSMCSVTLFIIILFRILKFHCVVVRLAKSAIFMRPRVLDRNTFLLTVFF